MDGVYARMLALSIRQVACACRHQEAMFEFQTALGIRQKHLGSEHPEVGRVYDCMGVALRSMGQYREAFEKHEIAIKVLERELIQKRVLCGDDAQRWYFEVRRLVAACSSG